MNERLRDWAEKLADSRLAESPTFRRMVANLDRVRTPDAPSLGNWDRRFERLGDRFATVGERLPNISWPKINWSRRDDLPRPSAAVPTDAGAGSSSLLLVLMIVVGAGVLLSVLLRRQGLTLLRRADGGWRLGPWPVRPEAVRTRDELVRAFEYLALLLLGPAARSRNHVEIAANLGMDAGRRAAAERLAGLYEQARYAPPDEVLPDADLAAARADLSLLARVAAA
jgi:hypothetical protein